MKCTIPEISWHNREPVLSVDIYPENKDFYRLASGGGDCHVLIWQMNITGSGAVNQEVISDLTRHQRAVNCVRWSPSGQYLASGDDDANIIIWHLKTDNIPLLEGETGDKEIWIVYKVMRGHKEDVYDLCWSIDTTKILSGSVDNTAILWDVNKGKMDHILTDHKGFVQGVSWDPKNQIIATISTDRMCRIFDPFGKQVKARIHKGKLLVPDKHYLFEKDVKFFHDDTFKSFFRRLQFTPDGSLLIVPSGHIEADGCKNVLNATLIFTLDNFSSPAVILPLPYQSSTVVRCCPILFELHEDGPDPVVKLPYRMIFAVGTDRDIILYDTQQNLPFARFQDIHYTRLTDLTWSQDGLLLIASSTDGFCSLITFEMDELGIPWVKMESEEEENPLNISGCEELKDENVDTNNKDIKIEEKTNKIKEDSKEDSKKRPSFLKQWAVQKPKKIRLNSEEKKTISEKKDTNGVIEILDSPKKKLLEIGSGEKIDIESTQQNKPDTSVNKLIPRRITSISVRKSTSETSEVVNSDDKKDASNPAVKVNVLVPRRIEPKLLESVPCTSKRKVEASCSTTKQSDLSKHEDVEVIRNSQESDDEEESSDSEAENLSKEELKELHKASENIREFFCRVPKKRETHSDANPIAVRRKPRGDSTVDSVKADSNRAQDAKPVVTATKLSDAKPIEVRRKPRDQEASQTNKLKIEEKTVSLAKDSSDAKPIAVKRKHKEFNREKCLSTNFEKTNKRCIKDMKEDKTGSSITKKDSKNKAVDFNAREVKSSPVIISIEDSDNEECNSSPNAMKTSSKEFIKEKCSNTHSKTDKECIKDKKETVEDKTVACNQGEIRKGSIKNKAVDLKAKNTEVAIITNVISIVDSDNEEYVTTPKKLLKKSSNKELEDKPPKIKVSSLIKRKSTDKTPKKTNALLNFLQKSTGKKTKKQQNEKEEVCIELSLDGNEARDAWKCDNKQKVGPNTKSQEDVNITVPVDDDRTEDFCLQLEDSQEGCDEDKTESQSSEEISKSNEIKNIVISESSEEKNNQDLGSVHKDEKFSSSSSNMPRTGRRVPLITLASPKGKTKKE